MDPFSAPSLGLGAASLLIQCFQGIKIGCEYFSIAAHMPDDCKALGWGLQMEYSKFLDWADAAGVTAEDTSAAEKLLKENVKVDPAIIQAVLAEMTMILQKLTAIGKKRQELNVRKIQPNSESAGTTSGATEPSKIDPHSTKVPEILSHAPTQLGTLGPHSNRARKTLVSGVDLTAYSGIFLSSDVSPSMRKYPKGFNHIVVFGKQFVAVARNPSRTVWAVHDKESFEEGLKRFAKLTKYLQSALGEGQWKVLLEQQLANNMALLQLTSSVDDIHTLLKASNLNLVSSQQTGDNSSIFSLATTLVEDVQTPFSSHPRHPMPVDVLFERLTRFALDFAEIDGGLMDESALEWNPSDEVSYTEDPESSNSPTPGKFNGHPIWIEWKGYKDTLLRTVEGGGEWGPAREAEVRVARLLQLLQIRTRPADFSIPRCLGVFVDNERFGFMYDPGVEGKDFGGPISLYQLLLRGEKTKPSLRKRVAMAQKLATTMLYLHAVGWLHKALRSASIIFATDSNDADLGNPQISGFEYARPDQYGLTATRPPTTPEWTAYAHPDYRADDRGNFRKSYDTYSLGVILLEIALWTPATTILEKIASQPRDLEKTVSLSPSGILEDTERALLNLNSPFFYAIEGCVGEKYCGAVKACLGGLSYFRLEPGTDESDPVVGAMLQQGFLRSVVGVLNDISV